MIGEPRVQDDMEKCKSNIRKTTNITTTMTNIYEVVLRFSNTRSWLALCHHHRLCIKDGSILLMQVPVEV